ncbi:hypothetical protein IMSHALPRED_011065 [Imshaugia aleurites]|uniref:Uncharacterized protein n=1 Tax=Imshaugia aleurites TaxID=172621 RepID=A0A8H3G6U4_9LECA|nr:hypothetical protein IMSHALPRED_011065 [Imshaugia aleurites]
MACGFPGNSDLFGLGIRVGYYTQIVAVWFSNYFYFQEAKSLRAVNNLFLLALIIVGFIFIINAQSTYVVHAFLLLQIGIAIGLVGITETARYATKYRETSRERLLLRMTIMIFGASFNVCFWWKGLDIMLPTPCGTYTFYFWRVGFFGWLKTLMKVSSLFAATLTAPSYTSRDAATLVFDLRMRDSRASFINAVAAAGNASKPSGVLDRESNKERHANTSELLLSASRQSQSAKLTTVEKTSDILPSSVSNQSTLLTNKTENIVALKKASCADRAILEEVNKAQKYLDLLMSIYPENTALQGKRRITHLNCLKLNIPHQKNRCSDQTPFLQCLSGALRSMWTNKPPSSLRQGVSLHLIAMGAIAPWKWPRIMNRMYELDQSSETPDWHHFTIASDLHLSQITAPNSTAKWAFAATQQFIFIALLIVQIELTLVWNNVGGLQSLSSLGQLIPFILGVGGLIKVLWGKGCLVWRQSKGMIEGRAGRAGEYEMAMARYWELKSERLDGPILRAATA